jgi:hypothetical protein
MCNIPLVEGILYKERNYSDCRTKMILNENMHSFGSIAFSLSMLVRVRTGLG